MPTYEYECTKCGEIFEYFQSVQEKPKTKCELCGGKLKKLVSAGAGLVFKGSGFYITDYKKKSSPESESKSESASTTSGADKAATDKP